LSYLPLYDEVWYQAANWSAEMGDVEGEIKTLNKALSMKGDSLLLHLALAEKHEMAGNVVAATQVCFLCADINLCVENMLVNLAIIVVDMIMYMYVYRYIYM